MKTNKNTLTTSTTTPYRYPFAVQSSHGESVLQETTCLVVVSRRRRLLQSGEPASSEGERFREYELFGVPGYSLQGQGWGEARAVLKVEECIEDQTTQVAKGCRTWRIGMPTIHSPPLCDSRYEALFQFSYHRRGKKNLDVDGSHSEVTV